MSVKFFKTRIAHFVYSLRTFVSAQVILMQTTAPGMFTNLCLVLLLLLSGPLVPKFHFQFLKKKTKEKSRKSSDIAQFGRRRGGFS